MGIGVGDRHAAHLPARDLDHGVERGLVVEQRIPVVGIAVRPPVDRDRSDIATAEKPAGTKHAVEIVANAILELPECHLLELPSTGPELLAGGEPLVWRAWDMDQVQAYRLSRIARVAISAEIDRVVELDA